ncbi:MAG: hypothetical protein A3E38_03070 [Candidatus Moranbacteria bacterium RIFCSPHIGHO2_12_FULL_54_9]|nr:MAG: hypothetical protein A3E38_03070 [Candidatus Moranbacteria bacterium RIFCSPHIGHO2_12_FULL_54_9]
MLDIHTHLFWKSYDADRGAVVRRAREAGVEKMICVGTTIEESRQAIAVAEQYENMFASVGMHPHEFNAEDTRNKMQDERWIEKFVELTKHPKVVAIGECGLDYFSHDPEKIITEEQKVFQKEGFLAQLELARELKLPVIVHTRPSAGSMDAYEDMFDILKHHSSLISHPASHYILHCYMGDTAMTDKFLTLPNVFFSFTGNITYPIKKAVAGTKDDLTETVKRIPLERLFIETDCPFLTPQAHRGERNEPAYVLAVAEKVADIKEVGVAAVEQATAANAARIFSF